MLEFIVKFFLTASAIIVIVLVMLQRGKGGGLAGALGGMGGQSAFGTKAGDLFTKITVGVASFWILISIFTAIYAPHLSGDQIGAQQSTNAQQNPGQAPETSVPGKPADSGAAKAEKGTGNTEKGTGKTEKSPEKSATPSPAPPAVPIPTAPTTTPPAAPAK